MLGYPRPEGKLILDTDASSHAVGAVLSQEQDGVERVLAYYSQTLKRAERQYCTPVLCHQKEAPGCGQRNTMSTCMGAVLQYAQTMQPSSGF